MYYTTNDILHIFESFGLASSRRTVHRLITSGELPAEERHQGKRGGIYHVVKKEDVEIFMEQKIPIYSVIKKHCPNILDMAVHYKEEAK